MATTATAAERAAGGRSIMGEVKPSANKAFAPDKASNGADKAAGAAAGAGSLRAHDAWGDAWVAEAKATKEKVDKEMTKKVKERNDDFLANPTAEMQRRRAAAVVDPAVAAEMEAEKEAAEKGRALRNGDPKWQKPAELCMSALADCRDGRGKGPQKDNDQCHALYAACLGSAVKQQAATQQEDDLYTASEADLKKEKHAAEKGRALRNGDPTFQTAEERCMARLADCRDGRDAPGGKQHTVVECHAVFKTCLAKEASQQQQQQGQQASHPDPTGEDGLVDCNAKNQQCKANGKSADECAAQKAVCEEHRDATMQRIANMDEKKETKDAKESAKKEAKAAKVTTP